MRRSPAAASLLTVTLLSGATLLIGSLWYNMQLRAQHEFSRRSLFNLQLANVGSTWQRDPVQGLELLSDSDRCPADLRDFTWAFLHNACNRERLNFEGHAKGVYALTYSADGRLLASASSPRNSLEDPEPYEVRIWDASTGRLRATLHGARGRVDDMALTPDSQRLITAVGYRDGTKARGEVTVWNLTTGKVEETLPGHRQPVKCIELSPEGEALRRVEGNKVHAAHALGITRRTLYRLIHKLGLDDAR